MLCGIQTNYCVHTIVKIKLKKQQLKIYDPVEIFVDGEKIVLQKYKAAQECVVTGEVAPENFSLLDGKLVLSLEGAERLMKELEDSLSVKYPFLNEK